MNIKYEEYVGSIKTCISRFMNKYNINSGEFEDLMSISNVIFVEKIVPLYDPNRKANFNSFLMYKLPLELIEYRRKQTKSRNVTPNIRLVFDESHYDNAAVGSTQEQEADLCLAIGKLTPEAKQIVDLVLDNPDLFVNTTMTELKEKLVKYGKWKAYHVTNAFIEIQTALKSI